MTELTSNIKNAGAHLADTRTFVGVWDDLKPAKENAARIVDENLLGLPTQSRARTVMVSALRPRFIEPNPTVIPALRLLASRGDAFRDACYYELTRVDALTALFVEDQLVDWWEEGRSVIVSADAHEWIDKLAADQQIPDWSLSLRHRVAVGVVAALRDCGRLSGRHQSPKKELIGPGISIAGFAYVAFRLHQQGESSRGILDSPVWRRWLLDRAMSEELMYEMDSLGIVYYAVAGSSLRVDWRFESLEDVVRAAL